MEKSITPLKEAPFINNFVFDASMRHERLYILFLEAVIGKKIERIRFIDPEKDLPNGDDVYVQPGPHLTAFVKDEQGEVCVVEIQTLGIEDDVVWRSRYHQCYIDQFTLEKGENIDEMKDTYLIFVSDFDCFRYGKAVYELQRRVKGAPGCVHDDGSHVLVLNSQYTETNANPSVLEFLDFVRDSKSTETTGVETELGKTVRKVTEEVRNDKTKEAAYMTFEMALRERESETEARMKSNLEKLAAILTEKGRESDILSAMRDSRFLDVLFKEFGLE